MKTVFTNDMVTHVWAQRSQYEGRSNNGNLFFEGDTIYSYGQHFPIARFVDFEDDRPAVVLLTTASYSVTTSAHVSRVRRSIPSQYRVFQVPHVSAVRHRENAEAYRKEFEERLVSASRSRLYTELHLREAEGTAAAANAYAELFEVEGWEPLAMPENLEAVKAKVKEQRAAAKAAAEKRKAEAALAYDEALTLWREGSNPHQVRNGPIALRLNGERIETTWGAQVPARHARKVWPLIARCRRTGKPFVPQYEQRVDLGHFRVDQVSEQGDLKAGCHSIAFAEIRRMADALGLPLYA